MHKPESIQGNGFMHEAETVQEKILYDFEI